ncbi:MAG: acyl-CoA dehydrogenase family protein, partial [Frankia sp.]|nr:acyl-CoA dehydrogenase family protein [Frankia sp.]
LADAGADLDDKLWERAVELGWPSLAVPEPAGGAGQGLVELCLVAEEVGRAAAPGPFVESALAAAATATGGAPDDVVEGLAEGTLRATVADADAPGVVHAAGSVDHMLVLGSAGVRLLPPAAARRRVTMDITRGWYSVSVEGEGVPLDLDPAWWRAAMAVLTAADALGVGERLLAMTVAYTSVREQFGRPIGSFQAVKHQCAEMLITLKGVRAATYRAAMALDARQPDAPLWASVAKAHASEGISRLAGTALQLHGGIGFTWEHDLHLYLRRAKADEAVWGNAAWHHRRVAACLAAS